MPTTLPSVGVVILCMFGGCVILSRVRVCVSGWNPMGHCSTGNNNQTKPNQRPGTRHSAGECGDTGARRLDNG